MDIYGFYLHRHGSGSGAPKKSGNQEIGKNVAGVGTKIPTIMGRKDPICVQITGANTNDAKLCIEMLNLLNHKAINRFVDDKAYDTNKIRQELNNMNIKAEIPNKSNRKIPFRFYKAIYKRHPNLAFIALAFIKLEIC